MSKVKDQYEAFPYPERDPKDERKRLITGSPSFPQEIDHFVFGGQRDWSESLRILVAGGGTGDGLIQLTTMMTNFGKPYEATYVDLSKASRKIAEERAKVRGLKNIRFITGSLLDAPEYGPFDYIDCCGVLHHLQEPIAGFRALRDALSDEGGMGFMVYAPFGRSGVYPLQEAFGQLFGGLPPGKRLTKAKKIMEALPDGHPFKSNTNVNDHKNGDAGFHDLLLHSQDRSYDVSQLVEILNATDWHLSGFTVPVLYDLRRYTVVPNGMSEIKAMGLAEKLNGTIRTHTAYAVPQGSGCGPAKGSNLSLVPHLNRVQPAQLAKVVAKGRSIKIDSDGVAGAVELPKSAAPLIAAIDGRRSLQEIATITKTDLIGMGAIWGQVEAQMTAWGMLLYSSILR